ncbi:MAG: hypothetical protein AB4042_14875 [Leptolyngbyaceae cyanobacterium]
MAYGVRSLLLTGIFGFILPVVTISSVFIVLMGMSWIPVLHSISAAGLAGLIGILHVFGSGHALQGILIISGTGCIVSILFDAYYLWLLVRPTHQESNPFTG